MAKLADRVAKILEQSCQKVCMEWPRWTYIEARGGPVSLCSKALIQSLKRGPGCGRVSGFEKVRPKADRKSRFVRKKTGAETESAGFAAFFKDRVEHLRERLRPRFDVESDVAG